MTEEKSTKKTVLVVEDEAIVGLDIQFILEDLGYNVTGPFPTLAAGMAAAEKGPLPDAAVLDVRLTDGDVFPLADMLAEQGVKIVFHSGHVRLPDVEESYPGAAFCPKPATPDRLSEAIREATSGAPATPEVRAAQ